MNRARNTGEPAQMPFEAYSVPVAWSVAPTPLGHRILVGSGRVALGTLSVALTLARLGMVAESGIGGFVRPWRLVPPEFRNLKAHGRLHGMSPADLPSFTVELGPQHAFTKPGLWRVQLPLRELTIADARYLGRGLLPRKRAHAPWELHLVGEDSDFTLRGDWRALAHLGTLGGWPEPE